MEQRVLRKIIVTLFLIALAPSATAGRNNGQELAQERIQAAQRHSLMGQNLIRTAEERGQLDKEKNAIRNELLEANKALAKDTKEHTLSDSDRTKLEEKSVELFKKMKAHNDQIDALDKKIVEYSGQLLANRAGLDSLDRNIAALGSCPATCGKPGNGGQKGDASKLALLAATLKSAAPAPSGGSSSSNDSSSKTTKNSSLSQQLVLPTFNPPVNPPSDDSRIMDQIVKLELKP